MTQEQEDRHGLLLLRLCSARLLLAVERVVVLGGEHHCWDALEPLATVICLALEEFPSAQAAVSLDDAHETRPSMHDDWSEVLAAALPIGDDGVIEHRVDRRLLAANEHELMDAVVFSNDVAAAVMLDDASDSHWSDAHPALAMGTERVVQVVSSSDGDVGAVAKDCSQRCWSRPNLRVIFHAPSISPLQTVDDSDWENFVDASIVTRARHDGGFYRRRRHVYVRHGAIACSSLAKVGHLGGRRDACCCCLRRVVGADRCSRSVSRRDDR